MSHYIIICKVCNVTISQCRCMSKDKEFKEGICSKCENEVKESNIVYHYDKVEQ